MDIGAQLREARESRGLTIAAVAATTRVPVRMLEAIEHNEREALPARPYARGFVMAFAREVGLDPNQIVRDYFPQFEEPPAAVEAPPQEPPQSHFRRRLWVPGFGVLALAIALGAFAMRRGESPPQPMSDAVGTSGTAVVTPPLPPPPPRTARNDTPVAAVRDDASRPAPAMPASGMVVTIQTRTRSWIAATADGKRQLYEVVPAGTTTTIRGSHEIVLRVGDAGGVSWSVDGREPVVMGRAGEVRGVRITPAGAATLR